MVCDPLGRVLTRGPAFEEALVLADIDVDSVPPLPAADAEAFSEAALASVGAPRTMFVSGWQPGRDLPPLPATECDELDDIEEIYRALVMGTRDYLNKTGFSKAIVGLSGGIDSALTAVVAADALGPANVLGITMPSRYSSRGSVDDSARLSRNLGIQFWEIPIEPAHTRLHRNAG